MSSNVTGNAEVKVILTLSDSTVCPCFIVEY